MSEGTGMTAAGAMDVLLAAVRTREEGEVLRNLLLRAELARECPECGELHHSAGSFCLPCRLPLGRNMPAEALWFIAYEKGVWHLRNGVGFDTLIFAYNGKLPESAVREAQQWAAGVMASDYELAVLGWQPRWETSIEPAAWVAVMQG